MDLKIATWNVQTMLQPGKMMEIASEMKKYSLDIIGLQEIRWQGKGRLDKKDFSLFYSGHDDRSGLNGTGFLVGDKLRKSFLSFEPINDRISTIRFKGHFRNLTMISVYAPTEEKEEEVKEEFYESLSKECNVVPKHDLLLVMGDFNAKIGREDFLSSIAGKHSLHDTTSENGHFLCQMATTEGMVIKSTCFDHKRIHKGTWKVPGTEQVNQIDHILISRRHASSILDVRTCRGPNCDSDHFLVRAILRERLSNVQKDKGEKRIKWNIEQLKNRSVALNFEAKIKERMGKLEKRDGTNINEEWEKIKTSVIEVAKETIGERRRRKNDDWFDEECREAIEKKNMERQKLLQRKTRRKWERYSEYRREAKRVLRRKKRKYLRAQVEELEDMKNRNDLRGFYQRITTLRDGFQPKLSMCKDKEGRILNEEKDILRNWSEYFEELLNKSVTDDEEFNIPEDGIVIDKPTLQEVHHIIKNMKGNKAPGEDMITGELLKYGGQALLCELHRVICTAWDDEELPKNWEMGMICPIFKKGDKMQCSNYRGISLLNVAYKVFTAVIQRRLSIYAERMLDEYQCGFRPGRSTSDQIFVMRQLMEKCLEYDIQLHILFIDFRQAFDSVKRVELYRALVDLGTPSKLVRLVKTTLTSTKAAVIIGGKIGNSFEVKSGVKQGDSLSATLFNLALHAAVKKLNLKGHIIYKSQQLCAYADDIALIARSKHALNETFLDLERECKKVGLSINVGKTKYLNVSSREFQRANNEIKVGEHSFEIVSEFKYLGTTLTQTNQISHEIRNRIMAGNRAFFAHLRFFKSKLLFRNTKIKLYKTLVRPCVTYGAETWTITKADADALRIFERKVFRRIYGPVKEGEIWRARSNDEIRELFGREDIVRFIKSARLKWLGHVERMDSERMQKRIMNSYIIGVKRRGRPRRRWLQEVEEDLKKMKVKGWKKIAFDREAWRQIVKEAKVHIGL